MKKPLSSKFTFFFKVIFPCPWIAFGLFGVVRAFIEFNGLESFKPLLFFCVWLGISFATLLWNHFPLKQVSLDDRFLYVSNFIKETTIPLTLVDTLKATGGLVWWRWPPSRIIVTFKSSSEFGREIKFIPGFDRDDVVQLVRNQTRICNTSRMHAPLEQK